MAFPGVSGVQRRQRRLRWLEDSVHAVARVRARGLPAVLLEIRQDMIADADGVGNWIAHLTRALRVAEGCAGVVV